MHWTDRVYGRITVDDPDVQALIDSPTFQRLQGVRQAGPSAVAFPFKNVTRFEHSLGVYELLGRFGASRQERVAGLLHDVYHTAFSHAVDFVVDSSTEQDHHESLKPLLLLRDDLATILDRMGYAPEDFFDDSRYPLLERPLPWLCADRIDYFLRDGAACGVVGREDAAVVLDALAVIDRTIVFTDRDVARRAVRLYAVMNRDWWASPTEAYIYNEFGAALREAIRLGILAESDLIGRDDEILARLDAACNPAIDDALARIRRFSPDAVIGYDARIPPKQRWLDPPIKVGTSFRLLSELD